MEAVIRQLQSEKQSPSKASDSGKQWVLCCRNEVKLLADPPRSPQLANVDRHKNTESSEKASWEAVPPRQPEHKRNYEHGCLVIVFSCNMNGCLSHSNLF